MGGYKVMLEAERQIISHWNSLKNEGKVCTAQKVLDATHAYIKANNRNDIFLPGLRKVQDIIKEARKNNEGLSFAEKKMQDPWSLATIDKYPIATEAIPAVLDVWRYSVNLGDPLTIRQAKWASRLHTKITDIIELWLQACAYANEDQLSLITNIPMRNFELDNMLVMGCREVETIKIPEFLDQGIVVFTIRGKIVYLAEDGGIIEEFLHALPCDIFNEDINYVGDYVYYLISLISALPSSEKYFTDVETRMVYLRHLSYLASVDNWQKFKPEEIRDIVLDLRKWVIETKPKIDRDNVNRSVNAPYQNIRFKDQWYSTGPTYLYPVDIYNRVGYTNYDKTVWERII